MSSAIPGISHAVDVWRDPWGIPHIQAKTLDDAFAALGYVHAQDRLWQMESLVRRSTGRMAELLGPPAVAADLLARRLDGEGSSRRDFALLGAEAKGMLGSYTRGVNAFISQGSFASEYTLLGAEPLRWKPWHSIAAMRQIGTLMGSVWWKLWRTVALPYLPLTDIAKLRFDDGGEELVCLPPGAISARYFSNLGDIGQEVEALLKSAAHEIGGGSNNWAVSRDRTTTGRPLVAGDPHRALEMPNMYAQVHLACEAFDAIGFMVPGVPGFPHFGHTAHVAWGVTHAFMDIHDLYLEKFDVPGDHYLFQERWRPVTRRSEVIHVKGAPAVEAMVIGTHHGPVFAGDPSTGAALTLRSVQYAEPDTSFDCLIPMLRAKTLDAFYKAGSTWGLIDHNLVAADTNGSIGHRVRAKVPKRPAAAGWLPVPGWTGQFEWDGAVAYEDMPAQIDPAGGLIVTANNRVVTAGSGPYLSTDAMPPHRARRILQTLQAMPCVGPNDLRAIFHDLYSIPAAELQARIAPLAVNGPAADLKRLLCGWDCRMTSESVAATAYAELRRAVTKSVLTKSGLGALTTRALNLPAPSALDGMFWWTLPQLLRANDVSFLGGSQWDDILLAALSDVAARTPFSPWGEVHRPGLFHQLSSALPDLGGRLNVKSAEVPGDNDTVFATGYAGGSSFRTSYAALGRYIFDVGGWDNCWWISFHGVSGEVENPLYLNQNSLWAAGEFIPMLYDWPAIQAQATAHERLE